MKLFIASLFFLLAMSWATADDVVQLSDSDFKTKLADMDLALVMFYAPWCGHCKRLKPEFEKAATDLMADDPPIRLAKVDCTAEGKEKCSEFDVSGYPTIKIFRKGELSQDYSGPREAPGIVKFMRGMSGPSTKQLKNNADFDKFISKEDVVVVGFFAGDSEMKTAFMSAADALRESVRFALVEDADVAKHAGGYSDQIVLFRPKVLANKFEPCQVPYSGAASTDSIRSFINSEYTGLVGHRTRDNGDFFSSENLVVAYFNVDYVKNSKGTNYWRNRMLKVVTSLKEELSSKKVVFGISRKDDFNHELDQLGVSFFKGDVPRVGIISKAGGKWVMEEEFSIDTFTAFLKKWLNGELEAYIKSEAIPEGDAAKDGGVLVGVAKNFDDLVTNSGRDVLVEFYAPWCGHCKKLTPVLVEVAEALKDEDVDVVKFDATANDVPAGYEVKGFPTLFWVKKGVAEPYTGGREKADFMLYIATRTTLKGYDQAGRKKEEL